MSAFWTIPEIWPGNTAYVLGGGPSLEQIDLELLHGKRCIGVNDAYALGSWVDVCFFGDEGWLNLHNVDWVDRPDGTGHKGLRRYSGLVVTNCVECMGKKGVRVAKRIDEGFSDHPRQLAWNFNSGAAAINLAALFGASRVVLVGFDMQLGPDGRSNWHYNMKDAPRANVYRRFMDHMERKMLGEMQTKFPDLEVLNASPGTALEMFPLVKLEDVL